MPEQLSEIRQQVFDRLAASGNDSLFDPAVVDRSISAANLRLGREQDWPWLLAKTTITVTTSGEYDLSSISQFRHVKVLSYEGQPLHAKTLLEFETWTERGGDVPRVYSIVNDTLYVAPTPTASVDLTLIYVKDEVHLSSDLEAPLLPTAYTELLVLAACKTLAIRKGDAQLVGLFNAEYDRAIREARDEVRRTRQLPSIAAEHSAWISY